MESKEDDMGTEIDPSIKNIYDLCLKIPNYGMEMFHF